MGTPVSVQRVLLAALSVSLYAQVNVVVPGTAQIVLAGQPSGTTWGSDSVLGNSPPQVPLSLFVGQGLRFAASGTVTASRSTVGPDGSTTQWEFTGSGPDDINPFGVGRISAPTGSLIGMFLAGAANPNLRPPAVNFTSGAKEILVLRPLLQQPFFIGSGVVSGGTPRTIVVPQGAMQLFLGVASSQAAGNSGSFSVAVSVVEVPTSSGNPLLVPGISQIALAGQPPGVILRASGTNNTPDSSPTNSPVQVDIPLRPGQGLRFQVSGKVGLDGAAPNIGPEGNLVMPSQVRTFNVSLSSFGISAINAQDGALIGVFVGARVDPNATPPHVHYAGGARELDVLTPLLQQPFLVGSGTNTGGNPRVVIVPQGATRLFLGVAYPITNDNTGNFSVTVSETPIPDVSGNPVKVPAIANISLAGQAAGAVIGGFGSYEPGDSCPLNCPPQANISLAAGTGIQFDGTGAVSMVYWQGQPDIAPYGKATESTIVGDRFGLGKARVPLSSLVGVFLPNVMDDASLAEIDWTAAGLMEMELVHPLLKQPFFIGSGKTASGRLKTYTVPSGATRLFLGVATAAPGGWTGQTAGSQMGSFLARVSSVPAPTVPGNPLPVPGTADIRIAGQPIGVRGRVGGWQAEWEYSPPKVDLQMTPGQRLHIVASGEINIDNRRPGFPPEGSSSQNMELMQYLRWGSSIFGIGQITGPLGALIGVFVGEAVDVNSDPPRLDFSSTAAREQLVVSPALQQTFFIGSGSTSAGPLKSFIVPQRATRLFLAPLLADGVGNNSYLGTGGNTGRFIVTVSPDVPDVPYLPASSILNGAGFGAAPLAAGSVVAAFGKNFAKSTSIATTVPLPTALEQTKLWFDLTPAPLFFVSDGQINAQVPFELTTTPVQVVVTRGGIPSLPVPVTLSPYRPGIFTGTDGSPVIVNSRTGQLVNPSAPARRGDVLVIYATGLGPVTPSVASGSPAPLDVLSKTAAPLSVLFSGARSDADFAGLAPGFIGVYQVNVKVPADTPAGAVSLVLSELGVLSNAVQISIQ